MLQLSVYIQCLCKVLLMVSVHFYVYILIEAGDKVHASMCVTSSCLVYV